MPEIDQAKETGRARERGMALVFTLLGLTLLSMLAASLMFVSSAGSFASMSFKSQMQASYAAGAGEQVALAWFRTAYEDWLNNNPTTAYDLTGAVPLKDGNPVTLGSGANFPDSSMASGFDTMGNGSITMGKANTSYTMTAQLLSHEVFDNMTGGKSATERWQLDVTGTVAGPLGESNVQERAIIERYFAPTYKDAIRGQCEVNLGGSINTDSFFSTNGPYCNPTSTETPGCSPANYYTGADAQASVGSNTFIQASGNAGTINGNAYYGIAIGGCTCPTSPCESFNHPSIVQGQILQAPGVPFPPIPAWTSPSTNVCHSTGGGGGGGGGTPPPPDVFYFPANSTGAVTFPPASVYGSCSPNGGGTQVVLCVGGPGSTNAKNFFFNELSLNGTQQIIIKHVNPSTGACDAGATACSASNLCGEARVYVNQNLSLGGGGVIGVDPGDPTKLSIIYSGSNTALYAGNTTFVGTIYAPNATLNIQGGSIIDGAVSAKNVGVNGSVSVHYDLSLQSKAGYTTTFRLVNQTRVVF